MGLDKHQELKNRTKSFALSIIRMSQLMPKGREANVIANQVLRSATSIAANYRAVGRARSKAEFVAKMGVVLEEADETVLWLELLADSGIIKPERLQDLIEEANQLVSIFSASWTTARN